MTQLTKDNLADLVKRLSDIPERWAGRADKLEALHKEAATALTELTASLTQDQRAEIAWAICPSIREYSCGEDADPACKRCPGTVETSEGPGIQACRHAADVAADRVLALRTAAVTALQPQDKRAEIARIIEPNFDRLGEHNADYPNYCKSAVLKKVDAILGVMTALQRTEWQPTDDEIERAATAIWQKQRGLLKSQDGINSRLTWRSSAAPEPFWEGYVRDAKAAFSVLAALQRGDEIERLREHISQLQAKLHCMCGSPIDHSPWEGHSPVSMFDHAVEQEVERRVALYQKELTDRDRAEILSYLGVLPTGKNDT